MKYYMNKATQRIKLCVAFSSRTNWEVFGKLTVSKIIFRKEKKP